MINYEFVGHQGDLCIFKCSAFPKGKELRDKQCKEGTLAYGEATGHAHQFDALNDVDCFKLDGEKYNGLIFIKVLAEAAVKHQKERNFTGVEEDHFYHNDIVLPPGNYFTGIVKETDHIGLVSKRVVD